MNMHDVPLTDGAVPSFFGLNGSSAKTNTILQCLHIKPMATKTDGAIQDRYRVILSDGKFYVQAMIGPANKHLVVEDILKKNSIVELLGYQANVVNNKRYVLISS
jgi:replication factor A1